MRYVKVDKLPELKKGGRNRLQGFIKEFMSDNSVKVAKLNWNENEYKDVNTARNSMATAIKRSGENLMVIKRGQDLYLMKIF